MSTIVSITESMEMQGDLRGGAGLSYGPNTYARKFFVETSDRGVAGAYFDPVLIAGAVCPAGPVVWIPRHGESYPNDPMATARKVRPERKAGTDKIWIVMVRYSSADDEEPLDDNPLMHPVTARRGHRTIMEEMTYDANGARIENTAHDLFARNPMRAVSRPVIVVRWNLAAVYQPDPDDVASWMNKVNDAAFDIHSNTGTIGVLAKRCQIIGYDMEPRTWQGVGYYEVTVTLAFREPHPTTILDKFPDGNKPDPWDEVRDSTGFREQVPSSTDNPLQPIMIWQDHPSLGEEGGRFVQPSHEMPLDGNGGYAPIRDDAAVVRIPKYKPIPFTGNMIP